ncbi:uncharacterized protein ATNIH1004_001541 [Aspergillus tanneri]|uniref:Uncharacterized protein n=1 Tax=Aspergillus tanneri TaxID=1220188 RepID=A0A5M9N2T9_9EURO|nr:uncharacterized protein ATNIH1004_001541 [Aspergillus tanneri]KAA8652636.1 hypothetical protein ATNIH1004_001541 [Aspergillus tanneri]
MRKNSIAGWPRTKGIPGNQNDTSRKYFRSLDSAHSRLKTSWHGGKRLVCTHPFDPKRVRSGIYSRKSSTPPQSPQVLPVKSPGSLRSIRRIVRQFQKHADANFSKILAFTQHSEKTCTRCENLERENSGLIDSFQEQKKRRKRG